MTYHDIYDMMWVLKIVLKDVGDYDVVLDPDEDKRLYETLYADDGSVSFRCSTKGLRGNHNEVEDGYEVVPIIGLLHEVCGHGGQVNFEFEKDTPLTRVLALNCYACLNSDRYYFGPSFSGDRTKFTRDYGRQPFELAAQYMGIKAAHNYFSVLFDTTDDPHKSDRMLFRYFEWAEKKRAPFVPYKAVLAETYIRLRDNGRLKQESVKFLSDNFVIDDALRAFDKKFYECIFSKREQCAHEDAAAAICPEIYCGRLAGLKGDIFKNCKIGVHQDLMMCAAVYHSNNYTPQFNKPVFRRFHWDYDDIFTFSPPSDLLPFCTEPSTRLHLSQMHNIMRDVPDELKVAHVEDLPDRLKKLAGISVSDTSIVPPCAVEPKSEPEDLFVPENVRKMQAIVDMMNAKSDAANKSKENDGLDGPS